MSPSPPISTEVDSSTNTSPDKLQEQVPSVSTPSRPSLSSRDFQLSHQEAALSNQGGGDCPPSELLRHPTTPSRIRRAHHNAVNIRTTPQQLLSQTPRPALSGADISMRLSAPMRHTPVASRFSSPAFSASTDGAADFHIRPPTFHSTQEGLFQPRTPRPTSYGLQNASPTPQISRLPIPPSSLHPPQAPNSFGATISIDQQPQRGSSAGAHSFLSARRDPASYETGNISAHYAQGILGAPKSPPPYQPSLGSEQSIAGGQAVEASHTSTQVGDPSQEAQQIQLPQSTCHPPGSSSTQPSTTSKAGKGQQALESSSQRSLAARDSQVRSPPPHRPSSINPQMREAASNFPTSSEDGQQSYSSRLAKAALELVHQSDSTEGQRHTTSQVEGRTATLEEDGQISSPTSTTLGGARLSHQPSSDDSEPSAAGQAGRRWIASVEDSQPSSHTLPTQVTAQPPHRPSSLGCGPSATAQVGAGFFSSATDSRHSFTSPPAQLRARPTHPPSSADGEASAITQARGGSSRPTQDGTSSTPAAATEVTGPPHPWASLHEVSPSPTSPSRASLNVDINAFSFDGEGIDTSRGSPTPNQVALPNPQASPSANLEKTNNGGCGQGAQEAQRQLRTQHRGSLSNKSITTHSASATISRKRKAKDMDDTTVDATHDDDADNQQEPGSSHKKYRTRSSRLPPDNASPNISNSSLSQPTSQPGPTPGSQPCLRCLLRSVRKTYQECSGPTGLSMSGNHACELCTQQQKSCDPLPQAVVPTAMELWNHKKEWSRRQRKEAAQAIREQMLVAAPSTRKEEEERKKDGLLLIVRQALEAARLAERVDNARKGVESADE